VKDLKPVAASQTLNDARPHSITLRRHDGIASNPPINAMPAREEI
jgi:hypothetical protein